METPKKIKGLAERQNAVNPLANGQGLLKLLSPQISKNVSAEFRPKKAGFSMGVKIKF